ncbi:MAG: hypothetical protein LCH56_16880 [Proteobacteria bacterium]|nr:hypothetical protein [Pseudomonadota bacterium]
MILGMSLSAFTTLHVVISLLALVAGIVVATALLKSAVHPRGGAAFLALTLLTSATGFLFPVAQLLPSHVFGILSLILFALAATGAYVFKLTGAWRWIYAVCVTIAFYLNAFLAVVQSFLKIPALNALAPTGSEPPFAIAQGILLFVFIGIGFKAVKNFRPATTA